MPLFPHPLFPPSHFLALPFFSPSLRRSSSSFPPPLSLFLPFSSDSQSHSPLPCAKTAGDQVLQEEAGACQHRAWAVRSPGRPTGRTVEGFYPKVQTSLGKRWFKGRTGKTHKMLQDQAGVDGVREGAAVRGATEMLLVWPDHTPSRTPHALTSLEPWLGGARPPPPHLPMTVPWVGEAEFKSPAPSFKAGHRITGWFFTPEPPVESGWSWRSPAHPAQLLCGPCSLAPSSCPPLLVTEHPWPLWLQTTGLSGGVWPDCSSLALPVHSHSGGRQRGLGSLEPSPASSRCLSCAGWRPGASSASPSHSVTPRDSGLLQSLVSQDS